MVVLLVRAGGNEKAGRAGLDYVAIVERVEELRGLRFDSTPKLVLLSKPRLRDRVAAAGRVDERRFPALVRASDLLPTLTGVATRDEYVRFLDQQTDVLGMFDFDRPGEVALLDDPAELDAVESEAILAHELTHALEYQHFPSARDRTYDDDGWVTSALGEGSAMLVEGMYRREHLGDRASLPSILRFLTEELPTDGVPAGLSLISAFPYESGTEYVLALHRKKGWAAVNAAHRRPPATSSEILHQRDVEVTRPRLPPAEVAGAGWRRLTELEIGEIDTRMLVGREPNRRDIAKGWAGGAAVVLQRGSSTCALPCADRTALALAWRMRTPLDARELAAVLERIKTPSFSHVAIRGSEVRMAVAPQAPLARRLATANASR